MDIIHKLATFSKILVIMYNYSNPMIPLCSSTFGVRGTDVTELPILALTVLTVIDVFGTKAVSIELSRSNASKDGCSRLQPMLMWKHIETSSMQADVLGR